MKSLIPALLLSVIQVSTSVADDPTPRPVMGEIIRLDPVFDTLVPPGAKLEVLASGLDWSEGPVWSSVLGGVLFSDVPQNTVFLWKEGEGLSPYLKPSGYTGPLDYSRESGSNGLTLDRAGRLVSCEHGDRRLSVLSLTGGGGKLTLTDNFGGKRYNSPNDACLDRAGNIFFTDPPYGLPKGPADQETREIPWNGVYRLTPEGKVSLLTKELKFPNGIALSPDEKTLYVAQSDATAALWMAYPLNADGTLSPGRILADVTAMVGKHKGLPDGLKVDSKGNLWATGPGGVHVMSPRGKLLGRLETFVPTGNCCFGGANNEYLYICADAWLCRVKLTP